MMLSRYKTLLMALAAIAAAPAKPADAQGLPSFRDERRLPQAAPAQSPADLAAAKARRQAEEDAQRKADLEQQRLIDLEEKRRSDETARRRAAEEAARAAAAEARRVQDLTEAARASEAVLQAADIELRRRLDLAARLLVEEDARRRATQESARARDLETKRRADDEARVRVEAELRRKVDEETLRRAAAEVRRREDAERLRIAEEQARQRVEEDARQRMEAEQRQRRGEEALRLATAEAKRNVDEATARAAAIEAAKQVEDLQRKEAARIFAGAADAQRLVARAKRFASDGDVASARLLYERAADAGSADAARALAATYEAAALRQRGAASTDSDQQLAARWSLRASELQAVSEREARRVAEETARRQAAELARERADQERIRATQAAGRVAAEDDRRVGRVGGLQRDSAVPSSARSTPAAPVSAPLPVDPPGQASPGAAAAPSVRSSQGGDAARFLGRGRVHLQRGDVAGARAFFERAADGGSADAALALAQTFDPFILATMPVAVNVKPDPLEARRWYLRAQSLGASGLGTVIERLGRP